MKLQPLSVLLLFNGLSFRYEKRKRVWKKYLGVLVRLDTVPWLFGSSLVDNNVGSVGEAVADVAKRFEGVVVV